MPPGVWGLRAPHACLISSSSALLIGLIVGQPCPAFGLARSPSCVIGHAIAPHSRSSPHLPHPPAHLFFLTPMLIAYSLPCSYPPPRARVREHPALSCAPSLVCHHQQGVKFTNASNRLYLGLPFCHSSRIYYLRYYPHL